MDILTVTSLYKDAVLTILSSICFFFLTSNYLWHHLAPQSVRNSTYAFWKWRNVMNSMSHAFISSTGSITCLLIYPDMAEDLIKTHYNICYILIAFSYGYFIFDAFDMLKNNPSRHSYELLIHHSFIYFAFGLALVNRIYIGYGIVSLVVEVNSIFLHIRQILIVQGYSKEHQIYRINSLINIGTYIVFRMLTLAWLTRWLVIHRDDVPLLHYTVGSIGLAAIILINIILFLRLLSKDFKNNSHDNAPVLNTRKVD